jgi:phosphoserine phosphatase
VLKDAIEHEIARLPNRMHFAVFDFDNTCIDNDIAEATLAFMCRQHLLRNNHLVPSAKSDVATYHENVFHHYHDLSAKKDFRSAYRLCAKIFAGFTPAEASELVRATIKAEGTVLHNTRLFGVTISAGLRVHPVVQRLISYLQAAHIDVWIVSASPEPAVKTAMAHFGIPGKVIAVRSKIRDGVFSDELEEPYPIAEGKVDCIRRSICDTSRPILAVGDSINDFAMIEFAAIHAIVNRNNELTHEAIRRSWYVFKPTA